MNIKLKELPKRERPRERLIEYGVENLNEEELLSIILKTGAKGVSVKQLSHQLLALFHSLDQLENLCYQQLIKLEGIGPSKACSILASIELGKRIAQRPVSLEKQKYTNAELLYSHYQSFFSNKKQEYFYCIYLDQSKRIITDRKLFIGTLNQSVVHPREVFKEAYLVSASAIICMHNHPSNHLLPSREDILLTNRFIEIGRLLGIPVIDHIIMGTQEYYSFFEHGQCFE